MYVLITFHEGQRLLGAIICAKIGIFVEKRIFFSHYGECMNETWHAYRGHSSLVCCLMFALFTKVRSHQGP